MNPAATPSPAPVRPLHVVQVVRQFAPAVGGLEEAVLKLSVALQALGVRVSVVTLDRIRETPTVQLVPTESVLGIPVTRIGFAGSWRYPLAPRVLQHLADADVVHVHAIDFFFDFLALTRGLHRRPLVASTHGGFFHTPFAQGLKKVYFKTITRASAKAYDRILASSRADFETFSSIAPRNLALVENGVDVTKWSALAPEAPERTMIAIGRLTQHKQLSKLVRMLPALRHLDPRWRLIIAGRTWDVEPTALNALAAADGVADGLQVVTGPSDADMAGLIRRASYLVSASSYEGFGLGVVEGMAAGLVPVLNRIPAFSSLVESTGCGVLVDFDDPAATARHIETLHQTNLAAAAELRGACMKAAARFGWPSASRRFLRHYEAVARPLAPTQTSARGEDHHGVENRRDRPGNPASDQFAGFGQPHP